ncbi:uncharacterized protein C8Q71DRAFT_686205, partial [Rhodofomes roseus]
MPALPQELVDYIIDYLWDEPLLLAKCCLVCRAWYSAAKYHLPREVVVQNTASLGAFVHMLVSKENRRYCRIVQTLDVYESSERPFVHTLPLRVRGYFMPRLQNLRLHGITWKAVQPHVLFFRFLSYFRSVLDLSLTKCHLKRAELLQRIINALPQLKRL